MKTRIDIRKHLASDPGKAMIALGAVDGVERSLLELVKVRTSQINGCAYCIDMHTKDARALGETEQRLFALDAWREAPFFSDRERAALEWTEALTRIGDGHASEDVFARVSRHLDEDDLVAVTFAVVATNAWNRLVTAFRVPVGTYQPARQLQT